MARPFTRAQALQNAAFVRALARTGNIRLAARTVGLAPSTLHTRRARHPEFAQRWDAAVTMANARFHARGGRKGPAASAADGRKVAAATDGRAESGPDGGLLGGTALRTRGGEAVVVRRRDGKLQLRRAQPGKLTVQCEQAFLAALSATANVRLAAAAAGASVAAFYRRRRNHAGFAREMRLALETGYERLETALLAASLPGAHADDAWRHNDPPPIPPMTANQALQLMYLHQKEARLGGTPEPLRRRKGESAAMQSERLALLAELRLARAREAFLVAEAARNAGRGGERFEPRMPVLPDLAQVRPKPHASSAANRETANARPATATPASDDTGFARGGASAPLDRFLDFARNERDGGVRPASDDTGFAAKPHRASKARPETAQARPAPAEPASDDTGFARGGPPSERPPGPVHDATRALFGGWRLAEMKARED